MQEMAKDLKKGRTFRQAHLGAMRKVGKVIGFTTTTTLSVLIDKMSAKRKRGSKGVKKPHIKSPSRGCSD